MTGRTATFRIWRGDARGGSYHDYPTEVTEGMATTASNTLMAANVQPSVGLTNSRLAISRVAPSAAASPMVTPSNVSFTP